jgi:hypothetical protein
LLCEAIQKQRVVHLRYQQDGFERTFEPHAVYISTKDNVCVSGTQTHNANKPRSDRTAGLRSFRDSTSHRYRYRLHARPQIRSLRPSLQEWYYLFDLSTP